MSEHGTLDITTVNSFSQLPFIRPSAGGDKSSSPDRTLRLFGFDFPPEPNSHLTAATNNKGGGGSGRKFECHYCYRNFPTSQALGGHQNAHKRERQHAKRAHLQSAAMAAHHRHPPAADGHVYSMLDYHGLGSGPSYTRFPALDAPPPPSYPFWSIAGSTSNGAAAQFCGGLGSVSQPINGSPLAGLWIAPKPDLGLIHRAWPEPLPPFGRDGPRSVAAGGDGGGGSGSSFSTSPSATSLQSQDGYESGAKDRVSLDLHL